MVWWGGGADSVPAGRKCACARDGRLRGRPMSSFEPADLQCDANRGPARDGVPPAGPAGSEF